MGDSHETLSGLIWSIPCTTRQVVIAGFVSDFREKQGFSPHHSETSRASEAHTVRCSDNHQQTATKNTSWSPFLWQKSLLIAVSTYLAENVVSLPFFAFQKMKMSRIIVFSESTRKFFKKRFDMTGWRIFLFIFLHMMVLIFLQHLWRKEFYLFCICSVSENTRAERVCRHHLYQCLSRGSILSHRLAKDTKIKWIRAELPDWSGVGLTMPPPQRLHSPANSSPPKIVPGWRCCCWWDMQSH